MKKPIVIAMLFLAFVSCKETTKQVENKEEVTVEVEKEALNNNYPDALVSVFNAHGKLEQWNRLESLVFEIEKEGGNEKTTTSLKDRKSLIEAPDYTIGYDGEVVWLKEAKAEAFKKDPKFYYNLMFYFYAMPFVLADDGITYTAVEPLVAEGKTFPGYKVSYGKGVGESPEDEYILYYDAETHNMAWLAYTVTYFSKEKSKDWHFIKYANWQTVNGFVLPETISWYKSEGFKIGEKRNDVKFVNVSVAKGATNASVFKRPEGASLAE